MGIRDVAEEFVFVKSDKSRKDIFASGEFTGVDLAWQIKELCYESWTNQPTVAQQAAAALETLSGYEPVQEIEAISNWIKGISELTKGNIEKSLENLNVAADTFTQIGKEKEAADTQVAKLIPLALLGKYDEAIETGEEILEVFDRFDDQLSAGKVEMNISNIVSRRGQHNLAETYCQSALKRFLSVKDKTWQTMAENGLANTYSELNDFQLADEFYSKALKSAKQAKMNVTEAEIEASLGNLAIFRGKFTDALKYLENSREKFEKLDMPHQTAIANLEIAEIYQTLNLYDESYDIYLKVAESFKRFKLQSEEARARRNLGRVATTKGETRKARKELRKSAKLYLSENNPAGAASVKLSQAHLELGLGDHKKSLATVLRAKKLCEKSEDKRLSLQANFLHGEILKKLGKDKSAKKILKKTLEEATKTEQHTVTHNSLNALGELALRNQNFAEAEQLFTEAIANIENLRSPLPAEEFRAAFFSTNLEPYENLAKLYLNEGNLEKAFFSIEQSRSRALADTVQSVKLKSEPSVSGNTENEKQLEKYREELNWYYSRLNKAIDSETAEIYARIEKLEKNISDLRLRNESTRASSFIDNSNLAEESFVKNLQETLAEKRVLVEFVEFDEKLSAFVITNQEISFFENIASSEKILESIKALQFQFGALRYGSKNLEKFASELKRKSDHCLSKLYASLIKPFEEILGNRELIVIPVSNLYHVPFAGLFNGENYLIEENEVVTSPSALIWQNLDANSTPTDKNALLIGTADENIPHVEAEIEAIGNILKNHKTLAGSTATFENVIEESPTFDILHFACHGQFRPDNPMFSSLTLANGKITVRDICSQNLKADLVTLSACETGLNEISAGEEILGLARGFLSAGVCSIVLSLWTVNDEATKELMKIFYTELQRRNTVAASLREAQVKLIEKTDHPYYWASFGIIGS